MLVVTFHLLWPARVLSGTGARRLARGSEGSIHATCPVRQLPNLSPHLGTGFRKSPFQDAIDWVACLTRPSARPILHLLKQAKHELVDKRGLDLGRLYVDHSHSDRGNYVRIIRRMRMGQYSQFRSPRHHFRIYIREMPIEEYFHRMYVVGKVPQCVSFDMRQAIRDQRVQGETVRKWAPYLTSNSRFQHRKELKRLHAIGQFDYYSERRKWIKEYRDNLHKLNNAMRSSRDGVVVISE